MATLKDVSSSKGQFGHPKEESNITDNVQLNSSTDKLTRYIIYKLANSKSRKVHIDGIDDAVLNPKTGKRERIWLLNGVDSIWQSDLVEVLKDKNFIERNRRSLVFEDRILRIPEWDDRAIEFANVCRHNIGNPGRRSGSKTEFFEYNPKKQQEEALAREYFELEMAMEAQKQPAENMRKHANFLGISFSDELGEPKTDDGIRREYMLEAKRNPKRFKETLNSKEVTISYLIKKAIRDSKIDIGGVDGNIRWANGGTICKLPLSRTPQEYLVELALTNSEDGKKFLEQIQNNVQ